MNLRKQSLLFVFFVAIFFFSLTSLFSQNIPTPESILEFKIGADYHLADYHQAMQYFKQLAGVSPRMKLFTVGKTSLGQDMTYAVISSESNIENVEKYKNIARRLAFAKGVNDSAAEKLAAEGKAIVYIDGGLHASECAPAQHLLQLAYDLTSTEAPYWKNVLDNTILVLVFANPDGMNILADWYRQNLGTPYEVSSLPWLYHKYVGHDNNRDSYMLNMMETQNLNKIINHIWFPQIVYNHHQTAPFPARIWIPPNAEPTNPNVHPLLVRWQNLIGSAMGMAFDEENKEGAISRIVFDTWYPGYVTQVNDAHNVISILTETALYRYATPHFYTVRDFPESYQDFTIAAFYPNPWKGGWWRISDAVDYCLTASKAVLATAARYKEKLLLDRYRMARDVIKKFKKEPPFGWIIPEKQIDPGSMQRMLSILSDQAIEIYRAKTSFTQDGVTYPAGTYIIPTSQAFGYFAKNMLEEQQYPDLRKYPELWQGLVRMQKFKGAPFRSYDIAGWTLPLQMNVKAIKVNSPLNVEMEQVKKIEATPGKIASGGGYAYLLDARQNLSYKAINRILKKDGTVYRNTKSFADFPAGMFIVPTSKIVKNLMKDLAKNLQLQIKILKKKPSAPMFQVKKPRIGLYKSWVANIDEGWTRWLFEQFEFDFQNIHDAEIKAGNLNQRFDVIIIPSQWKDAIINGNKLGTMPPEYIGGLGYNGVENLKTFAENGGTIIGMNSSCDFLIESLQLPVSNLLKDVKSDKFVCSGSILRMEFDTKNPIAYGMEEIQPAVFNRSPVFKLHPSFEDKQASTAVAKYPRRKLLLSGFIYGEKMLQGNVAVADVPVKNGRCILLGFAVKNRDQALGTFKLLFNSVLYGSSEKTKSK
ncbi:MAG: hypothetical protein GXO74_12300 [Calditrichaeota bacterium]|nr:hypothetical protein [Calditrichota bacterium]